MFQVLRESRTFHRARRRSQTTITDQLGRLRSRDPERALSEKARAFGHDGRLGNDGPRFLRVVSSKELQQLAENAVNSTLAKSVRCLISLFSLLFFPSRIPMTSDPFESKPLTARVSLTFDHLLGVFRIVDWHVIHVDHSVPWRDPSPRCSPGRVNSVHEHSISQLNTEICNGKQLRRPWTNRVRFRRRSRVSCARWPFS